MSKSATVGEAEYVTAHEVINNIAVKAICTTNELTGALWSFGSAGRERKKAAGVPLAAASTTRTLRKPAPLFSVWTRSMKMCSMIMWTSSMCRSAECLSSI